MLRHFITRFDVSGGNGGFGARDAAQTQGQTRLPPPHRPRLRTTTANQNRGSVARVGTMPAPLT